MKKNTSINQTGEISVLSNKEIQVRWSDKADFDYFICSAYSKLLTKSRKPKKLRISSHSFKGAKCIEMSDMGGLNCRDEIQPTTFKFNKTTFHHKGYRYDKLANLIQTFVDAGKTKIYFKIN